MTTFSILLLLFVIFICWYLIKGPKTTKIRFEHQLTTGKSPREFFRAKGWREELVSGGWGYDGDSALKIHINNETRGVDFEYMFIQIRAEYELNGLSNTPRYTDIQCHNKCQRLMMPDNGKSYDVLEYTVTAVPVEGGDAENPISYDTECYFDISDFYGHL